MEGSCSASGKKGMDDAAMWADDTESVCSGKWRAPGAMAALVPGRLHMSTRHRARCHMGLSGRAQTLRIVKCGKKTTQLNSAVCHAYDIHSHSFLTSIHSFEK